MSPLTTALFESLISEYVAALKSGEFKLAFVYHKKHSSNFKRYPFILLGS